MFAHSRFIFLTFSDNSLKVISINLFRSKPKIIFFDQHILPPGVVFDDSIVDFIRFKDEVRRFLSDNQDNLKSHQVVLALNEQEVFLDRFVFNDSGVNLKSQIGKYLEPRLPYLLNEATVRFRKSSTGTIQLISTKHQLIRDLESIFENTSFVLKKLEPLPLPCVNLLASEQEPYIFVLAEDQTLTFGLVIEKVIVFSSSLKILKDLKVSRDEFLTTVKNLITVEYEKNKVANTALQNIFITGQDSDLLKNFLEEEDLKPEVINLLERFTFENSSDISDYTKALLSACAAKELLSFSVGDEIGVNDKNHGSGFNFPIKKFLAVVILIGIILLAGIALFFIFNSAKSTTKGNIPKKTDSIKISTASSTPSEKPAEKTVETPPQIPPSLTINKSELKIQILNGTTTKGLAGQTKDFLSGRGYAISNIGNAESNYDQTTVKFKVSKESALNDLTKVLSERYSVIRGDHLSESDQFDFIIIVGRK